jgi:LytS/YehU family sensor histidine kinase
LRNQLQPHFLFNALNGIATLVRRDQDAAHEMLISLSELLRLALSQADRQEITLAEELDFLERYLEIQRMRFGDRLSVKREIDPEVLSFRVSPLLLQPLVENAVRHGIDPSEDGGRIEVSVNLRGDRCHLTVSDTGVGLQATGDGLGTGLSTLRERLQLAFGGDAQLRISELVPHGVHAEIEFPAQRATA